MSTLEVDKVIPQSGTATQIGENGDTINVPSGATLNINSGATIANNGTATGFDTDTNDKVKVSSNDTTAGFLNGKLVAGTNISLTEGSDGGNETLTAAFTGTIGTSQIGDSAVTTAKINDGAITSAKLGTNVGGKVLQAQTFVTTGNNTHTTSTTYTDTVTSINITPLSSNSKILVFADHAISLVANSSNQRCDARIFETTTSTSVTDKKYIGQDGGNHAQFNFPISLSGGFTNSSTAQKTFKVQVRKANADANECSKINLNWYNNALHTMMAIEVQA
jgi:hypothetical protein